MEEQIVDLQMQMTFHDDGIEALNTTVAQQALQIHSLREEVQILKEQVRALLEMNADKIEDAPPPHY